MAISASWRGHFGGQPGSPRFAAIAEPDAPGVGKPGPEISVVIPTYNRSDRCASLLRALATQTLADDRFEVLAVDDCSPDDTSELLTALAPQLPYRLRVVRTVSNSGPASARNAGWRAAAAPVVACIDDDCIPDPGWLESGLAFMQAHPSVGVAQGCTRAPDGVDVTKLQGWYLWRVITQATPYFDACNIFYRRQALEAVGGFDEEIAWWSSAGRPGAAPVAWGEDSAAGWAVVEAGWGRDFVASAVVVHGVELRGWWWHVKYGYLDRIIVGLAVEHPGYREEAFWRPWAYRRDDAAFVAAVAGVLAATRWRPAALAILPYLWWRRPSIRRPRFVRLCFQTVVVDAARALGRGSGALKYRTIVV